MSLSGAAERIPEPEAPPQQSDDRRRFVVGVIGNPNTGKTTLFNALTGLTQRTGNYPGVTVERALGEFRVGGTEVVAVDLPGVYSLSPRSPDEMVAVEVLAGVGRRVDPPDAILCVLDGANLERNLYLLTQLLEVGLPVVVALTMTDVARRRGVKVDAAALERCLGVPVVPVHASRGHGVLRLREVIADAARAAVTPRRAVQLPTELEDEVDLLQPQLFVDGEPVSRFLVERLLLDPGGSAEAELAERAGADAVARAKAARARLAAAGWAVPQMEVDRRYDWISSVIHHVVRHPTAERVSWTERIDGVLTHKVWGLAVFVVAMAITFQAIFSWAVPLMDLIDGFFAWLGVSVAAAVPEGPLQSLLIDGVIGGAGAVVIFVPQIAILFALITLLEDSGYMARAAFLMDRVMGAFGLSGRSFIPLLSSFACAVPGIMAARTIENRRDRIATIVIAPLMSCSARLPVYVLLIAAFVPAGTVWGVFGLQGLTLLAMYMLGLIVAPAVALLLKRTVLSGEPVPFLLELPPYKVPSWRVVLFRMYDRSLAFIRRAGTIILATAILIWALSYYPAHDEVAEEYDALRAGAPATEQAELEEQEAAERLRRSFLGQAGRAIEPVVEPLGWDWKIGMAALASFPAREVVIAALGTIYSLGSGVDEESGELRQALRAARWPDGRPVFTLPVALSLMVFFALCCQCAATLATIRRETGSWRYPVFTFVYMTGLAYVGALATYQTGTWLSG